jgi:hypothetical protein
MLAAKDPIAMYLFNKYKQVQMPNTRLGPKDVQLLIQYLELETKELQKPAADTEKRSAVAGSKSRRSELSFHDLAALDLFLAERTQHMGFSSRRAFFRPSPTQRVSQPRERTVHTANGNIQNSPKTE